MLQKNYTLKYSQQANQIRILKINIPLFIKAFRRKNSIFNKLYIYFREMPLRVNKTINAIQMLIIFLINPSKLYKYSWRNCLPSWEMRDIQGSDFFSMYKPNADYNFKYLKDKVNLIIPGFNGKVYKNSINFFLNCKVNKENLNSKFITSDCGFYEYYQKKGVEVIYVSTTLINKSGFKKVLNPVPNKYRNDKYINLYLKTESNWMSVGSAIPCMIALNLVSQNLNVMGWNCYFDKQLSKMNNS